MGEGQATLGQGGRSPSIPNTQLSVGELAVSSPS